MKEEELQKDYIEEIIKELRLRKTNNYSLSSIKEALKIGLKKGIQEGKSEAIKDEIEFLNKQIRCIKTEMEFAKKANTNNGNQSIIIFNMILIQLNKRLKQLQEKNGL